jgi:pimeloyl-ACP methyl ester carboxylesterase
MHVKYAEVVATDAGIAHIHHLLNSLFELTLQSRYSFHYLGPGSRPVSEAEQTLAYGLNDSPVGLAAWIVEKYRTWSDCNGDVESRYTKDELLTIATIYRVTQSISSSTRIYLENQSKAWEMDKDERVQAPAVMAIFPQETARPPREWGERLYNVRRWEEMPRGGHFAALEKPELLAQGFTPFSAGSGKFNM